MVNFERLFEVYEFAKEAHGNQKRETGESYITHPVAVANIAQSYGADDKTIYACLLHDVVEDTCVSFEEIKNRFGKSVAYLVDGVTKIEGDKVGTRLKVWEYAKIDKRVALIKLADRIHNVSNPKDDLEWRKDYMVSTNFYIGVGREFDFDDMASKLEELNKGFGELE
ncbi:MAG: HD domain-containing protein [archaeon]